MVGAHGSFVFLLPVHVAVVDVVHDRRRVQLVVHQFEPFLGLQVAVLGLTEDINEIDALHKHEELLEIQTGELQISFELGEYGVQNGQLQFLAGAFRIGGSLLEFSPVKSAGLQFILSDSHEHVVLPENGHESQKLIGV